MTVLKPNSNLRYLILRTVSSNSRMELELYAYLYSPGYMHSGYPMMGFTYSEHEHVNATGLMKLGTWGIIHEIGHNHQWMSWTVDGTTETGCNWFSLYVNHNVGRVYLACNLSNDYFRK